MRLFTKIFLCGTLVFGLTFSGAGYFLLHYSMEGGLAREIDFALEQYQYDKFTVQAALLTYTDFRITLDVPEDVPPDGEREISLWRISPKDESLEGTLFRWNEPAEKLFAALAEEISVPAAFFAEDGTPYYSEIEGMDFRFLDGLSKDAHVYRFWDTPEGSFLLVGSMLDWNVPDAGGDGSGVWERAGESGETERIYFVTLWDVSKTMGQQDTMRRIFFRCYAVGMAAGMALLGLLAAFLSGPLKRMSGAAKRMAKGDYEERLAVRGRDEIGELAASFNQLAAAVEEKVRKLQDAAREKEDFVANFAHELKTPLTSIIGYADMLYQKGLSREEVRGASWYIWNEGMRLEALSLKLMDLAVMGRQQFVLEVMPADELLRDVAEGLAPLLLEKEVKLSLHARPAYVRVEYDLFKTLLINLIDNSIKAGGNRIELSGEPEGGKYRVCVRDNGCGMPKEELPRIKEAFYMVDKARSRKQHGAGLGLALAERIAQIHGGGLMFESREGQGTAVSLLLESADTESEGEESGRRESVGAESEGGESGRRGSVEAESEGGGSVEAESEGEESGRMGSVGAESEGEESGRRESVGGESGRRGSVEAESEGEESGRRGSVGAESSAEENGKGGAGDEE